MIQHPKNITIVKVYQKCLEKAQKKQKIIGKKNANGFYP